MQKMIMEVPPGNNVRKSHLGVISNEILADLSGWLSAWAEPVFTKCCTSAQLQQQCVLGGGVGHSGGGESVSMYMLHYV